MTLSRWCRCSHDAFRLRCPKCYRLSLKQITRTSSTNSRSVIHLRSSSLTSLAMHMIRKSPRSKCGLSGTLRSLCPTLYTRYYSCCGIKTAISGSYLLAIRFQSWVQRAGSSGDWRIEKSFRRRCCNVYYARSLTKIYQYRITHKSRHIMRFKVMRETEATNYAVVVYVNKKIVAMG